MLLFISYGYPFFNRDLLCVYRLEINERRLMHTTPVFIVFSLSPTSRMSFLLSKIKPTINTFCGWNSSTSMYMPTTFLNTSMMHLHVPLPSKKPFGSDLISSLNSELIYHIIMNELL
uniref:Uncharacterized protein n=1 Tax=Lactuca sativa TaxID=4236 RepID=A0A9R1VVH0_LACSA|nr:hypothetical protein LSAT_V11C400224290 [Lactuca sativa]